MQHTSTAPACRIPAIERFTRVLAMKCPYQHQMHRLNRYRTLTDPTFTPVPVDAQHSNISSVPRLIVSMKTLLAHNHTYGLVGARGKCLGRWASARRSYRQITKLLTRKAR